MKKISALFITICLVIGLFSVNMFASSEKPLFQGTATKDKTGEILQVDIRLSTEQELVGFVLNLKYDNAVLQPIEKENEADYYQQALSEWGVKMANVNNTRVRFVAADIPTSSGTASENAFIGEDDILTLQFNILKDFDEVPLTIEVEEALDNSDAPVNLGGTGEIIYNPIKPPVMGDFDGSGEVTLSDTLTAAKYAAKVQTPTAEQIAIGDINQSGAIEFADVIAIAKIAAKLK